MSVHEKIVEFAQKLYDENMSVHNVNVSFVTDNEFLITVTDKYGRVDKYWVVCNNPESYTWMRVVTENEYWSAAEESVSSTKPTSEPSQGGNP